FLYSISLPASAQNNVSEQTFESTINSIKTEECPDIESQECRIFNVTINERDKKGSSVDVVETLENPDPQNEVLTEGDRIFLQEFQVGEELVYVILGPVRNFPLALLALVFVVVIIGIGRLQGFGSLVGLILSVFVLFGVTTPMILSGTNPILAGYIGAVIVLASSIFFSHGFNKKSFIALGSSAAGLLIISVLTFIFLNLTKLTGFGDDSSLALYAESEKMLDLRGILFASIIIGGIGVLDDIAVNQVSAIQQIYLTDKKQDWIELYKKAMVLGRDHIASLVNTLFIAYASASMPIVMLLQATNSTFIDIINSDQFAEEIVRAILGSIGLILVVPISSIIGAIVISKYKVTWKEDHTHVH
ncbi:MAG TPA: YibE/F family protein, partial [Candidatus Dojkabacteria bacterium]